MESRNILVTGGSGFLGSNLVQYLLSHTNDNITIIDNFPKHTISGNIVKIISDDITNLLDEKYSHLTFDVIFHVASYSRIESSFYEPLKSFHSNSYGTAVICEFSRKCNAKLIYTTIVRNDNDDYFNSPHSFSKKVGEDYIKLYHTHYHLSAVNVHLHNVYGPGEPEDGEMATIIGSFLRQYRNKLPLTIMGDGNQMRDFIHVEDVCHGLLLLSRHPNITHCPTFELGSGIFYTINNIINMFYPNPVKNRDYIIKHFRKGDRLTTQSSNQLISPDKHGTVIEFNHQHNLKDYIQQYKDL